MNCYLRDLRLSLVLVLVSLTCFVHHRAASQHDLDSLRGLLKMEVRDTADFQGLIEAGWAAEYSSPRTALRLARKALAAAQRMDYRQGMAQALNDVGVYHQLLQHFDSSLIFYRKALVVREELGDVNAQGRSYINIGAIHDRLGQDSLARMYFKRAEGVFLEIKDSVELGYVYNSLAGLEVGEDNTAALELYQKSLAIRQAIDDSLGIAECWNNLAVVHQKLGNLEKSLGYYTLSRDYDSRHGYLSGYLLSSNNCGLILLDMGRTEEAIKIFNENLELAQQYGQSAAIKQCYSSLNRAYLQRGDYRNAHGALSTWAYYQDSIYKAEVAVSMANLSAEYETEKKDLAIANLTVRQERDSIQSVQATRERDMAEARSRQRTRFFLIGGGLLLGLLAISFYAFLQKRKSNRVISAQKAVVEATNGELEEKNREIMDSITYARRLQEAILPSQKLVKEWLNESFILYKPRDIVAGDFYWMQAEGDEVWYAAADCTGHGVPGAMVSVVCANALNRSFKEFGIRDTGLILDKVRELVIDTYSHSDDQVKDGMDIALCRLNLKEGWLEYSGAHNPLWHVRPENSLDPEVDQDGDLLIQGRVMTMAGVTLTELKADKQPVGVFGDQRPFTANRMKVSRGDCLYLFSDGFADQFGGEDDVSSAVIDGGSFGGRPSSVPQARDYGGRGKKFKSKNLKKTICSIYSEDMEQQREILNKVFEDWKGELEQVDDVCVIGVRV